MSSQIQYCNGLEIENDHLVQCLTQLNENSHYCDNHKDKYRFEKPDECAVCMESISEQNETPLECGHWIHKQCLINANKHNCPMCRQQMYQNEIEYIFGVNQNVQNNFNFDNIEMYNNLEHFMNDYPFEFPDQNQNYWNQFVNQEVVENENNSYQAVNENPFEGLQDENIDTIIRDIEISPRNNPFVNVSSMLNMVNPDREDDLEEYIMNIIENYASINDEHINVFSSDIIIRIMSIENDLRLFSIGFNFQYQQINSNFYFRILTLMENRIRDIYEIFHQ